MFRAKKAREVVSLERRRKVDSYYRSPKPIPVLPYCSTRLRPLNNE
jgi:hypothetical protein